MKKIAMTTAAAVISATGAFAQEASPEIIGAFLETRNDEQNLADGVEIPESLGSGDSLVLIRVYPGMNTNGEDLRCLETLQVYSLSAERLAPSCNWQPTKP